jgi:regulator of protease activity HflC (stomatin/prohibitin superfamily)
LRHLAVITHTLHLLLKRFFYILNISEVISMFTTSPLLTDSKDKKKAKKTTHGGDQYAQLLDTDDVSSTTSYQPLAEEEHKVNAYSADLLYTPAVTQTQNKTTSSSYQQHESALMQPSLTSASVSTQAAKTKASEEIRVHASVDESLLEQPASLQLSAVVVGTQLTHQDSRQQAANIVAAFNANVTTSALTPTSMWGRGERLDPSEFLLVHRNKVAELATFNKRKLATIITGPGTIVEQIGKFQQNAPYFGAHGSYVVNVPQGQYAKVWRGNRPVLLGEGPHVIHDATLKFTGATFNPITDFVDQNPASNHIHHGSINIVRVPPGQIAKININGKPHLLEHRAEPYAFNAQNFQFGGLVSQATQHIDHGNMHIIRVPQGQYAKITINGEPRLLKPSAEPYVFNTPYFVWGNFVDQTASYIGHGNKHILRVPPGHVGKVTVDGVPHLLESRPEPYEFDTLYFKLEGEKAANGNVSCFEDATKRLIKNGNLKRLIPRTGEVAVTYNNGKLEIISPSEDQQPIMIQSATHDVDENFLPIGIKTLIFPSEETKKEKRKDNSKATEDEVAYEVFTTKDSLRVGVKLMVAYEISDPALAMRRLVSTKGILEHIENCAVVDMGKAIQRCSSQEFLSFYQTKPRNGSEKQAADGMPSAPPAEHFQDEVKNQLSADLAEYGIKLVRLNIETPKVLDESIAKEMGSQSIATAQASATEATLAVKFNIARQQAQQEAEVARIQQEQRNNNVTSAARATFEATKLNETAKIAAQEAVQETANRIALSKAQNDLEAAKLKAQVIKTDSEAKNEQVKLEGQRLHDYPALLQLELARIQFAALAQTKPNVTLNVTSEEMRNFSAMSMNPFMMFANNITRTQTPGLQQPANTASQTPSVQSPALQTQASVPNSPRSPRMFTTPANATMISQLESKDVSSEQGNQQEASRLTLTS